MEMSMKQQQALALARARLKTGGQQVAGAAPYADIDGGPTEQARQTASPVVQSTLQERSQEVFGFKPYEYRGSILPFGRTKEGETEFAWPQMAVDVAESTLLPGHVVQGGSYTPEDVLRFGLDVAAPATGGTLGRGGAQGLTRRGFTEAAPSTEDVFKTAGAKFKEADEAGLVVDPERYMDFMVDLENNLGKGLDEVLHPKANRIMEKFTDRLGEEVPLDLADLQVIRRQLDGPLGSNDADERRLAMIMRDTLDTWISKLSDEDLVAGSTKAVDAWRSGIRGWARGKKSGIIDGIIEKAQLAATGFENGLVQGFRGLLNNKKLVRGFSDAERNIMKKIVKGVSVTTLLRLLGRASFGRNMGSNFLGGSLAGGAGYALAGPVGAVAAPAAGWLARKGAETRTINAAQYARALAASGGVPPALAGGTAMSPGTVMATRAGGPMIGTYLPRREEDAKYRGLFD